MRRPKTGSRAICGETPAISRGGHGAPRTRSSVAQLLMGLVAAAVVLAPWRLTFAVDVHDLYEQLYPLALEDTRLDSLGWLAAAGFGYQEMQQQNDRRVVWLSRLSAALGVLMVAQTVLWLLALRLS
jgi:hypothetical protein